jgi:hypothetical protein
MKIRDLGFESNGTRNIEIRAGELSYRALLRRIQKIQGTVVSEAKHDPMNDNTKIVIRFEDVTINIDTPFSDYIISCATPSRAFDDFVSRLSNVPVKWWERFF